MSKIFVVGSYVQGLTIRVPRQPVLGENVVGDSFDMGPGGKGTNQAIAAARLGQMSTCWHVLGMMYLANWLSNYIKRRVFQLITSIRCPTRILVSGL